MLSIHIYTVQRYSSEDGIVIPVSWSAISMLSGRPDLALVFITWFELSSAPHVISGTRITYNSMDMKQEKRITYLNASDLG